MKKLLRNTALILLATVFVFSSCKKKENEDAPSTNNIVGDWKITNVDAEEIWCNGVEFKEYLKEELGLSALEIAGYEAAIQQAIASVKGSMSFFENGTYKADVFKEEKEGTWMLTDDVKNLYLDKGTEKEVDFDVISLTESKLELKFEKTMEDYINIIQYINIPNFDEDAVIKAKVKLTLNKQ